MMTRDEEVHLNAVFADKCPTDDADPSDGGGPIDGLNLADKAPFSVGDEIATVGCDGECTPGVENDVDNVVSGLTRK